MRFIKKIPPTLENALQTLKKNRTPTQHKMPTPDQPRKNKPRKGRKVSVMSAQSFGEAHSAPSGESLDQWD